MLFTRMTMLGIILRQERTLRGWSLRQFAERADIDVSLLSRIESGVTAIPHEATLEKLAPFLDEDVPRLREYAQQPAVPSSELVMSRREPMRAGEETTAARTAERERQENDAIDIYVEELQTEDHPAKVRQLIVYLLKLIHPRVDAHVGRAIGAIATALTRGSSAKYRKRIAESARRQWEPVASVGSDRRSRSRPGRAPISSSHVVTSEPAVRDPGRE